LKIRPREGSGHDIEDEHEKEDEDDFKLGQELIAVHTGPGLTPYRSILR
jgi:hypothetical protein